jgi:undecaprenyl-diphosphatase
MASLASLHDLDRKLFERVASAELHRAHPVLTRLGRAADHGVLWLCCAAALGALGDRTARRAALRGTVALGLASAVSNGLAKPLLRRGRPDTGAVPLRRLLHRPPLTTSFPSGHTASAAAFTTGLALESPLLGAAAAPLAAGVATSRVYTGAHYPGDVLAGAALGASLAVLTCRWWPRRPAGPVGLAEPTALLPPLPDGTGLVAVVNSRSGSAEQAQRTLSEELPGAALVVCGEDDDVAAALAKAARQAAEAGGALGVVGGDGTVGAAAAEAVRHRVPLAVFPGGTLNHFAAGLGIEGVEQTVEAVRRGRGAAVDVGRVRTAGQERYFLNTFSLGAYAELVRTRAHWERQLGKWPALVPGLLRVLSEGTPVQLLMNGHRLRLWLLFVGNGRYEPRGFAPTYRDNLADGLLDLRLIDGSRPLARARLVAAFLTGALRRSRVYREVAVRRLVLKTADGPLAYSVDGEPCTAAGEIRLDKLPRSLTVYRR